MLRPKLRPVTPEAAASAQAAVESASGAVFLPAGAATFDTKNGQGRRWSARLEIVKAYAEVGGKKDEPNEDETVFTLITKAVPYVVDEDKKVPPGTMYYLRVRVNYARISEGDEMAIRNEGVLMTLFTALGVQAATVGIPLEILESAFPTKDRGALSTLRGKRLFATLSLTPGSQGGTFLNVDRFVPDTGAA
jgi:hypothetical protein